MLDALIKQMIEQGLMSVMPMRVIGKARPVFDFWSLMSYTREYEPLEAVDFGNN